MRHFPIFLDLRGRSVVVAGGGDAAEAKLRLLLKTEAEIRVFATSATEAIRRWSERGVLSWNAHPPKIDDMQGAALAYAASGVLEDDERTREAARAAGVPVNVVDDLERSQFITPAIVDRDPVVVAIGTEGSAPMLATRIRSLLESMLSLRLGQLARIAANCRAQVGALPAGMARRSLWARFFEGEGEHALEHGGPRAAAESIADMVREALMNDGPTGRGADMSVNKPGRVALVGAGPGDPDLLTLKARRALERADVVLFDRLVDPRIVELSRREATLIDVGKSANGQSWKQADINVLMIEHAAAGRVVVRLKSGDPVVFGRADEEMDALEQAGIDCEIVPGITSASAAGAAARVSLTRRGRNSAFTLLTAHDTAGYAEHDWRRLARPGTTFAVYMGLRAARFVQGRLLLHGIDPGTPVTVVENVSRDDQKMVCGDVAGLTDLLEANDIKGPSIIFIGLAARSSALPVGVRPDTVPDMNLTRAAAGGLS